MSPVTQKRQEAGLTMAEVARRAGWLFTKLWKIEHGQRHLYARDIPILAKAIGCAPCDLLPTMTAEEGETVNV